MSKSSRFYISASNKKGVFIFLGIALVIVFLPRLYFYLFPTEKIKISSEAVAELDRNYESKLELRSFNFSKKHKNKFKSPPSKFDPNQYTKSEWMYLGLSSKQADVVLKFTSRRIYSNEQLSKIFVIPNELFDLIKDSTEYPARNEFSDSEKKEVYAKKEIQKIEINSASQEELEKLPGIGSFYAKNILKYREKLGGFNNKEQLLEVWKMEIEKFNQIEPYVLVNNKMIHKINLNSIKVEELKSHPYLNWNIANSIVKIRDKKGGFSSIEEIKESLLIDEELFEKIKPYLSL